MPELGGKYFGCSKPGQVGSFQTVCYDWDAVTTVADEHRTLWW